MRIPRKVRALIVAAGLVTSMVITAAPTSALSMGGSGSCSENAIHLGFFSSFIPCNRTVTIQKDQPYNWY